MVPIRQKSVVEIVWNLYNEIGKYTLRCLNSKAKRDEIHHLHKLFDREVLNC